MVNNRQVFWREERIRGHSARDVLKIKQVHQATKHQTKR